MTKGVNNSSSKKSAHRHQHLMILPTDIRKELDKRLSSGISPKVVCEWLQDEKGYFTEIKRFAMMKRLLRYRQDVLFKPLVEEFSNGLMRGRGKHTISKLGKLDAISELEGLIEMQKKRLEKALKAEANLPLPTDIVRFEVDQMRKLLADLINVYLEVGVLRRAPKQIGGTLKPGIDGGIDIALTEEYHQAHGEESRKLISALLEKAGIIDVESEAVEQL